MKFILLINVKMPTIVGIITFISRIKFMLGLYNLAANETSFDSISIYSRSLNFMLSRVEHEKSFINMGPEYNRHANLSE